MRRLPTGHECARHPPGTEACYTKCRCGCADCRAAHARYQKKLAFRRSSGHTATVDGVALGAHLAALGMTPADISAAAGVARETVRDVMAGARPRVLRSTATKLLGVTPTVSSRGWVDSTPTARRVKALQAIGWSHQDLATHMGLASRTSVARLARPGHVITAASASAVARAYEALRERPAPPSVATTKTLNRARKYGWPAPSRWDAGDGPHGIDGVGAMPWPLLDIRTPAQRVDDTREDIAELMKHRESQEAIAARIGRSVRGITAFFARHGPDDTYRAWLALGREGDAASVAESA